MNTKILLFMMIVVALTMVACGGDDDGIRGGGPDGPIDTRLLGKWEFDHQGDVTFDNTYTTWEFYANGVCTCQNNVGGNIGKSTYFWQAENGVLKMQSSKDWETWNSHFKDGLMTLGSSYIPDDEAVWYRKYADVPRE